MMNALFRWPTAATASPFTDDHLLAAMLRFEVALAHTQAGLGLIPASAAMAIAGHAASLHVDCAALVRDAAHAGSPAIPFVRALREHVARHDGEAADHVHYGTTSQDLLDSALVLCLKPAVATLDAALLRCREGAVALARAQRATPMLARTLMQPAGVTTFGYKAVLWAHSLSTARIRLQDSAADALVVSLGGAIGNLAFFGDKGAALRAALAQALELSDPGASWHAQRERLTALACEMGMAGGVMTKIARDLALMMQAEVGEVSEPMRQGRGGSTAMPHKHNPVLTMRVLAATQALPGLVGNLLAGMAQEHERALGGWQAEMDQYRMVVEHTLAAAQTLAELLEGLHVDVARCRANIDALHGTIFSEALTAVLARAVGKHEAQSRVAALCVEAMETKRPLQELAHELVKTDPVFSGVDTQALSDVFDLRHAALASEREADRVLRQLAT